VRADPQLIEFHGVGDAPVQRGAELLGALGGVLGDVDGHGLGGQVAGPGRRDRADVGLATPAHQQGDGLV
jgi:hypothetical protein